MTITKQRVEEIISRIEMYGHGAGYTADEVYDLAVLALNLSNIAKLKRYELDMDGCDSFGQDCGVDMTEDSDGDYVLFDDVVKLFEFDTTTQKLESPAKEAASEYRHDNNDRYAPKYRSGTSRLALHHVPYMAMAGFHFPETVEKTAQTGTTPEGIRSVL